MRIHANPMTARLVQDSDSSGRGSEIIIGIFCIDPAFNGMPLRLIILTAYRFARCYFDLFFDQIEIHDFFRNAMFYLYTRIHFHEIEIAVLVYQEFNGAYTFIINGRCCFDSSFTHPVPEFRWS